MKKYQKILLIIILLFGLKVSASGGVSISKTSLNIEKNKTATFEITATNAAGSIEIVSTNPNVATVNTSSYFFDTSLNNSKVTITVNAIGVGNANIEVRMTDIGTFDFEEITGKKICSVTVTEPVVNVTGVSLNKSSITLNEGNTETLVATVNPSNATNKGVTWASSNTSVATVDNNGKVTAKAKGTATITVTSKADSTKKATCTVNVNGVTAIVNVESVVLNKGSLTLDVGKSETLVATVSPSNATNKGVTWTSSNTSVATVDNNGKVTAKAKGTATITVTSKADSTKRSACIVNVNEPVIVNVTNVILNKSSLTLDVGKSETLVATVNPSNATNKSVTWTSSDTNVATVDSNGKVTAKAKGSATITVKSKADSAKKATCTVTVNETKVIPTDIEIIGAKEMSVGSTINLSATVLPSNANQNVKWESSNEEIATVSKLGVVTSIKEGTVVIKAISSEKSEIYKTHEIVIKNSEVVTITITGEKEVTVGNTITLSANVSSGGDTDIEWLSSNNNIAIVNNGVVEGISHGTVTIEARLRNNPDVIDTYEIIVNDVQKEETKSSNSDILVYVVAVVLFALAGVITYKAIKIRKNKI